MFDFFSKESHNLYTIFHLLGVIVGMGGALTSDAMFFSSIRDEKVTPTEMRFLKLGSRMVWIGLVIVFISGALLFSMNPERYLSSHKFLAKMTIVVIIAANGFFFHFVHFPRLRRHVGHHFPSSDEFMRKAPLLIASGVISIVSWLSALVLGAVGRIGYSYFEIMGAYLIILVCAVFVTILFKHRIIPHLR